VVEEQKASSKRRRDLEEAARRRAREEALRTQIVLCGASAALQAVLSASNLLEAALEGVSYRCIQEVMSRRRERAWNFFALLPVVATRLVRGKVCNVTSN
jgi:hypothetical protein